MSVKTRLRLSIVVLVVGVVLALSALSLHSVATALFEEVHERASASAFHVQSLLVQRVTERTALMPPPTTLEETKALWRKVVEEDEELSRLLADTMASSRTIVEISIADENSRVLISSDPYRAGYRMRQLPDLAAWSQKSTRQQLIEVLTERLDYQATIPLGIPEQPEPVFQIQAVVSSVLLHNAVEPQIRYLAILLSASLGAAILLAVVASNIAFRPLAKIGEAIDRIARGEFSLEPVREDGESSEYKSVQSKLNMLGQQFRGAREDVVHLRGNIDRLLERLEEAVLLFDRDDRLIMAGRAAESLLGIGRWEMLGRTLDELFPQTTSLGVVVQSAVHLRRPLKDHPLVLERGEQTPPRLLVNVELLEDFPSRTHLGTLVTLRDAETRRQIESQLDVSTRLAAISRLTGGVAHEIKNPLNAIALHLEILRAKLDQARPELRQEIEVISSEITRLDRVVKTFLDFTRPVELRLADVDLAKLVREVAALVRPEASKHRVEVVVEWDGEPVVLRGDRDLLKQAVLNVVVNGVEAMKAGGRLEIQARRVGGESVLSVADQGAGIPPEASDKIFNLYFTTKGKGSGIGLAMTFRIVQLHNGSVDFASDPGKGTTFWLRFPAAEKQPPTVSEPAREESEKKA